MSDQSIVVLGIPVPSSAPIFLAVLGVHVAAGLVCVATGLAAMLAPKRAGRHPRAGSVYYWGLVVVFVSMSALSILRWPHNNHLFALGVGSYVAAVVGRRAIRLKPVGWTSRHAIAMAASYILLLTAFYVDNGPNLPLWRALPPLAFWLAPSLIGLPILAWVLRRHPLIVGARHS